MRFSLSYGFFSTINFRCNDLSSLSLSFLICRRKDNHAYLAEFMWRQDKVREKLGPQWAMSKS